eukprot:8724418-Pyramimonas_sp.AAC.2
MPAGFAGWGMSGKSPPRMWTCRPSSRMSTQHVPASSTAYPRYARRKPASRLMLPDRGGTQTSFEPRSTTKSPQVAVSA